MQGNYITNFLESEEIIWEGVIENDNRIELHTKMKQKPHWELWRQEISLHYCRPKRKKNIRYFRRLKTREFK
ncbi:hypothetical protein SAMN02745195_01739 [Thermoanaerobacter uzonensis DSM 18761]|uniref:Uncharacterized protein n=1 Tax=Thermoanaerobacter uzonensis DSM 18761 TaxID=1123369 RepID=A0A1M4YHT1_9THEO|nr:hypothetical protein SAMN02745195_01739 [Thermoanaerobacter uzonensis DSM 18761]